MKRQRTIAIRSKRNINIILIYMSMTEIDQLLIVVVVLQRLLH